MLSSENIFRNHALSIWLLHWAQTVRALSLVLPVASIGLRLSDRRVKSFLLSTFPLPGGAHSVRWVTAKICKYSLTTCVAPSLRSNSCLWHNGGPMSDWNLSRVVRDGYPRRRGYGSSTLGLEP